MSCCTRWPCGMSSRARTATTTSASSTGTSSPACRRSSPCTRATRPPPTGSATTWAPSCSTERARSAFPTTPSPCCPETSATCARLASVRAYPSKTERSSTAATAAVREIQSTKPQQRKTRKRIKFFEKILNIPMKRPHRSSDVCREELKCERGGYTDPKNCSQCRCPRGFGGKLCEEVAKQGRFMF